MMTDQEAATELVRDFLDARWEWEPWEKDKVFIDSHIDGQVYSLTYDDLALLSGWEAP